jgi:AraC-like DNA-binding protein
MAIFKKKPVEDNSFAKINRVKPLTNVLLSLFFTLLAIGTVLPVLLVVSISISSSESLAYNGFAWIPFSKTVEAAALRAGASDLSAWFEGVRSSISFTAYEPIETPSFCIKLNNITECLNLFNKIKTQLALKDKGNGMLFSYFYRLCAIYEEHRQKEYAPRDPRMIAAKEYIDLHFDQKDCLDLATEQSKISRRRFNELFKKQFGITPNRYLTSRRIDNALTLLSEQKISVSEASDVCGFGDVYYFSKVFKSETGYSPGKFKKLNKN